MKSFNYNNKDYDIIEDNITYEEIRLTKLINRKLCTSKNENVCAFSDSYNSSCMKLIEDKKIPDCVQYNNDEYVTFCTFKENNKNHGDSNN